MKRLVFILLALVLCMFSITALAESSSHYLYLCRDGYYAGAIMENSFYALQEDGLYSFNDLTKELVIRVDCTPSAGLLFNSYEEGYALQTDCDTPKLIYLDGKTGSSQFIANISPKFSSLAGMIGNHIYYLGFDEADKNGVTGAVLYRQEIGSDAYTIVHRGVGKVCQIENHIFALGWQYDPVPVECAIITEDAYGIPQIEYMPEYVLDIDSFTAGNVTFWSCNAAAREGNYNTVYNKSYIYNNGRGEYQLNGSWNADEIIPGPLLNKSGFWQDIKGMVSTPGDITSDPNNANPLIDYAHNAIDVTRDLSEIYPQNGGIRPLVGFIYKRSENRIYRFDRTGKTSLVAQNIPDHAHLLYCTPSEAYMRATDSSEVFAIELDFLGYVNASPTATPASTTAPTPAPTEEPTYQVYSVEFTLDMADYKGKWTFCSEDNYEVYLPENAIYVSITQDMVNDGYIEYWQFMEGTLGIRHLTDPDGNYYILDAYLDLQQTYSDDQLQLTELNGVPSLMFIDEASNTLNLMVSDSNHSGVYHFVATPGNYDFIEAAYDIFESIHAAL